MNDPDPAPQERRTSSRRAPSYTAEQILGLGITKIHFRDGYMFCLLSDGNRLCVPLSISKSLEEAPDTRKYQWQIVDDGKTIVWPTLGMGLPVERLSLWSILTYPQVQIMEVPGA